MKRRLLLLLMPVMFLGLALFFYVRLSEDPSARDSALMARDFPPSRPPRCATPSGGSTSRCSKAS